MAELYCYCIASSLLLVWSSSSYFSQWIPLIKRTPWPSSDFRTADNSQLESLQKKCWRWENYNEKESWTFMSPWVLTVAGSREDFSAVGRMRLRSFPLVANFFLDKIEQPISYKRMVCWRLEPSYTVYSKWHTLQNHVEIIGRTQTNIHGVSFFFVR